ncbi:site-specific DNA-methyltransferase [Roseiconus nitratireducens]|uniref:Site-specific DNA-methyltransferase n=1 Tax=Roseiconus nitratireducens TaxID=2605748 RepID=A0A5M6DGU1_9BACT|nr:site-specific DNA-methyltransferase [Roseiconus nitratireducens]KAA5544455.1 site-specific DNA-methyltransferase [Roseiconus nitratireducens]
METAAENRAREIGPGRIHQGDCIDAMRSMDASSVQLVFADPPFNIGYEYDQYDDRLESDQYLEWSGQWMREVHRVLDDRGAFWLAIGDEYAAELKVEAQRIGFHPRSWVVWYYTFGVHCRTKFTRSHAHLFHFVKDPSRFTFNASEIAVPSARQLVYADKRANPKGRMPDDTWILRPQDCVDAFTPDEDCWYFPRVAGTFKERAGFHGCQMPEQLLGRIIRSCSNPDDVVLDPFSGSGTTLAVAKKLGRQFLGFEMSTEYARLGQRRIEAVAVGDSLEGSPEPKASAPATHSAKARRAAATTLELPGFAESVSDWVQDGRHADQLVQAFCESNRGYSVDRVVADPLLNEDFQVRCDRAELDGTPAERNRALFALRKSGRMKQADITTSNRTAFDWEELDPFLFAVEIAWRSVSELYADAGLDEILCDPRLAEQFDAAAGGWAPGFTALQYRWAALKLRKAVSAARRRLDATNSRKLGLRKFKPEDWQGAADLDWDELPQGPAAYLIRHVDDPSASPTPLNSNSLNATSLYCGETANLQARLRLQLSEAARQTWPVDRRDLRCLQLAWLPVSTIGSDRLVRQLQLQKWYRPVWNFNKFLPV